MEILMWFSSLVLDGFLLDFFAGFFIMALFTSVVKSKPGWSTFIPIFAATCLEWFSPYKPLSFAIAYPFDTMLVIVAYFLIGSGWIVVKWWSYVHSIRDQFTDIKPGLLKTLFTELNSGYRAVARTDWLDSNSNLTPAGEKELFRRIAHPST